MKTKRKIRLALLLAPIIRKFRGKKSIFKRIVEFLRKHGLLKRPETKLQKIRKAVREWMAAGKRRLATA